MITFNALSLPVPAFDVARETAWLRRVVASHGRRLGEVNYVFCDDEEILEVNRRYLRTITTPTSSRSLQWRQCPFGRPLYLARHRALECRAVRAPV